MFKKLIGILYLFFSAYTSTAQGSIDSFPLLQNLSSFELVPVQDQDNTPGHLSKKPLSLFIFLSSECPLCQNYALAIRQLKARFNDQVNFYGIFPGNAYTQADIHSFEKKYKTGIGLYLDESKKLTRYLNATVTPQVILLNNNENQVYSGAIDDWVQGLGKKKQRASQHYLQDAIEQSLQSVIVKTARTKAFGCKINDY
ncbi:MAG: redoxin domain-containing protein [Ferruginibacter sp.]|nr:redoxin domain-containing protein [Ferruginibacter sp.]